MIVCIAEKPSVAKDIARIIGATSARDGYMEGNGYQVTWTFGHLCCLKEPNDYAENWKRWSLAALPMIPPRFGIKLIDDQGIKKQFAVIQKLMTQADSIVNCGDAGQEGELIQRWVMQMARATCPVKRLWISSMTDEATLALIVNRQKEIDQFKPEPYWVLATIYRNTQFTATQGKFTSREEGEQAFATIEGKPFRVTGVQKKKGTEAPPHLYDLTSLQVDCNKKFSYSAEMTLNIIQSLYEKKLTTYPRVDTQFLSDDIYPKCPGIMNGLKSYHELMRPIAGKPLIKPKRIYDEERTLEAFVKGEEGPHTPTLTEKQTTPPKPYTEATLLRAMETAGKFVDNEELRAALKENGIGRPSSRAGIIETLFKRHYIRRERKNLIATPTGIQLIDMIHERLLTSCELTGIWEKKLRDIEHKKYDASQFVNELKVQITDIVNDVLRDNSNRRVTVTTDEDLKKKPTKRKAAPRKPAAKPADAKPKAADSTPKPVTPAPDAQPADPMVGRPCPKCGQGTIIKGKTAYGCSRWREGCDWRQPLNNDNKTQ